MISPEIALHPVAEPTKSLREADRRGNPESQAPKVWIAALRSQ
jgi:hypothetical protein